ncbi:hypothetical protein [Microbacterium soli]|uniref:Glycosyltransferase n=1 Tax=Microbacterium soli TaxID=446075 RepID=A0ABP7MUN2_9MICO
MMKSNRRPPATVVFYDSKTGRGGGQAVLESLLMRMSDDDDVRLVMPSQGLTAVSIPPHVRTYTKFVELENDTIPGSDMLLICNTNAGMPALLRFARTLRAKSNSVRTFAIVHNYPMTLAKSAATRHFLKQFDDAVVVEPGLLSLHGDAHSPGWLSLDEPLTRSVDYIDRPIRRTGRVKSYGRPDPEKGLDLLPKIYSALTARGYTCEVALGGSLGSNRRYADQLRSSLAPWLVDGQRNSDWIDPGDVFVIASRAEAACLLAQEVLSRGAFGVVSRVGLMPYLSPDGTSMRGFAPGKTASAISAALDALTMPEEQFSAECLAGVALIEHRAGLWHDNVVNLIRQRRQVSA